MGYFMQVSVEMTKGLERKLTVRLPAEQIQEAVDERMHSIRGTIKLDGFRPGKVPYKVVKKRFGGQVRQEVLGDLIQSSFQQAVTSQQLRPVGIPNILPLVGDEEGDGFGYTAVFEVFPEFELASVEALEIERPVAEIIDTDIDLMIEELRKQHASWNDIVRPSMRGDQVVIDFNGTVDGEEMPAGRMEKMSLELGSNKMIPGFEDQLVDLTAGEDKTIQVGFPDDYQDDNLAGKEAEFAVHVHAVKAIELPALDDEFFGRLGIREGGIEAFRKDVTDNVQRQLEQIIKNKTKRAVMNALVEANALDIPKSMVVDEIQNCRQQVVQQMQIPKGGDTPDLDDELFREESERRVKLGLVVAEIIKSANLEANPEKIRESLRKIVASYEEPEKIMNYYYQNPELLKGVERLVLEQEVTDWVTSQCKVIDIPTTYQELVNAGQPA